MANDFEYVMSKCSDKELFKIISGPDDEYQPTALEAAKTEFAKRNLAPDKLATVEREVTEDKRIKDNKANEPLDVAWKILACMFPGLFQLMFSRLFIAEGYNRKAKELVKWTLIGFGVYGGLVFLFLFLDKVF